MMTKHSNSIKGRGRKIPVRSRLNLKPRVCAADGCRNRFTPISHRHIYCGNACGSYMRMKRKRGREKERERTERLLSGLDPIEFAQRAENDARDELAK